MNPDTNRLEALKVACQTATGAMGARTSDIQDQLIKSLSGKASLLLRPDGSEVPKHWSVFTQGEYVVVKDYTFKVAYINEGSILLEPVGPCVINQDCK